MGITTISSREFDQDTGSAKRAAENGPVIITDGGRPAHVLMTFDAYQAMGKPRISLYDAVAQPDAEPFDFDPPRMGDQIFQSVDFD